MTNLCGQVLGTQTGRPDITIVISSTVFYTLSYTFSTFRPSLIRIALPCCGDVDLLVTFQLYWAWRGLWVCVFPEDTGSDNALSLSSMDALEAVGTSMFADITVSAVERLWLFTADIVWFEVV